MKRFGSSRSWRVVCGAMLVCGLTAPPARTVLQAQKERKEWRVPRRWQRRKNPVTGDAKSLAAGRRIFLRECLSCHGPEGKGNGPAAKDLETQPGNLSDPKMWEQTDGAIHYKIRMGRTPMPTFDTLLGTTDRWHVVNYIRTLAPKPGETRPAAAALKVSMDEFLDVYFSVARALVKDELDAAKKQAGTLGWAATSLGAPAGAGAAWKPLAARLRAAATAVASSADLKAMRSSFKAVSEVVAEVVERFGHERPGVVYALFCPAAGATWLQESKDPQNPYLGAAKPGCGEVRKTFPARENPAKKQ